MVYVIQTALELGFMYALVATGSFLELPDPGYCGSDHGQRICPGSRQYP